MLELLVVFLFYPQSIWLLTVTQNTLNIFWKRGQYSQCSPDQWERRSPGNFVQSLQTPARRSSEAASLGSDVVNTRERHMVTLKLRLLYFPFCFILDIIINDWTLKATITVSVLMKTLTMTQKNDFHKLHFFVIDKMCHSIWLWLTLLICWFLERGGKLTDVIWSLVIRWRNNQAKPVTLRQTIALPLSSSGGYMMTIRSEDTDHVLICVWSWYESCVASQSRPAFSHSPWQRSN